MNAVEASLHQWLEDVVLGLKLCPFAAEPLRAGRVRVCVSDATGEAALLDELQRELQRLAAASPLELETTLVAIPKMLDAFFEFNDFLDAVNSLLVRGGWEGEFQVASFHPRYQFEGTQPDDIENHTNRSPVPVLHILREASVEAALAAHPDPERIPRDNIRRLRTLSAAQRQRLLGDIGEVR